MIDIENLEQISKELLKNRGLTEAAEIFDFFHQDIYTLSNPFEIANVFEFIERVQSAVKNKEHVLIYGDKDADGITASAIMYNTLKKVLDTVHGFVPTLKTGYGLSKAIIEEYAAMGITLIITVDCGISNLEEVAFARELGLDIIVTDHHDIPEILPDAYLIFNPKLENSGFGDKNFCGCAVAFKLMEAFVLSHTKNYNKNYIIFEYSFDKTNGSIEYIKAMRVRNFIIVDEIFAVSKTSDGYLMEGLDEIMSEEEALEELASYMFEDENVSFVITGSSQRFEKLLSLFKQYDIYMAEYDQIINIIELAKRSFNFNLKAMNTLEDFANALNINLFKYSHLPHSSMHIRLALFSKLFLMSQKSITKYIKKKSILVSFGTVADVVSTLGENRTLVKSGLDELYITEHERYKTLLEKTLITKDNPIDTRDIGWKIAPFINAAGRLGEAQKSFEFLTSDEADDLEVLSNEIYDLNQRRKELTEENFKIVEKEIKKLGLDEKPIIIVRSNKIEQGFTGLIAGKVLTTYGKTAVIMYENDDEQCVGSIRSRGSHNARYMLEKNKELLIAFGGHKNAAGFTVSVEQYEKFESAVLNHADEYNFDEQEESLNYEMILDFKDINIKLAQELDMFKPFGMNNLEPIFHTSNVTIMDIRNVSKTANKIHAMFNLKSSGKIFSAVKWSINAADFEAMGEGVRLDIIYKIKLDTYGGNTQAKLFIESYKII